MPPQVSVCSCITSGNKIEGYWAGLFTTAMTGRNINDLIMGNETVAAVARTETVQAAPAAGKKVEEAKEEEEDFDMGGMFD